MDRFTHSGRRLSAHGTVRAVLSDGQGHRRVVEQRVTLSAKSGPGCGVLHLRLDRLDLKLLGLNAQLDRVILDITGKRQGGVLGKLFCRLAGAKGGANRARIARAMTSRVQRGGGQALRFSAYIVPRATSSATGTCQVLDLVVGPLNLDLLGLVVDLQRVHLSVTATRGEGKLGDLFCQLADNNTGTTTTTTTTTTTAAP